MKLTRQQIRDVAKAIAAFDGTPEVPMKLTMQTRYSLGKNLRILKGIVRDIDGARDAMIRSIAPNGVIPQGSPLTDLFDRQWKAFLDIEEEVEHLMRFTLSELNLDVNAVPVTALCDLGPLIIEDEKK